MTDTFDRLKTALADRYTIEEEVGAGGMATVYLAEDLKHHRKVAVKVLRPELAAALGPERFLREIEIAAQLQHPHILPLHDSGEADGFLYYVMPYVKGESLRERLAQHGELPIAEAVKILREIVDALTHAHEQGVVHRDIKPDNVMLSGRHALVTDFGVAKAVSEATGRAKLTTAGVALGTPSYMAPEQATADPTMDHRADIYAVGAVGYEMLTGRPPFTGTTPQMILAAHVTEAVEPVTKHRESVPHALNDLILRCLEKKPADRWQSAEELLPQLEALTTPSGGMTPTQTQPLKVTRRRRVWPLGAGVAVAAAAILVGTMSRPRAPTTQPNVVLVVPFENATGDATQDALAQLLETAIKEGLQQTGLAEVLDSRAAFVIVGGDAPAADISTATAARRLAESVGAGLLVMGRYLPVSDSLQIEASLLDLSARIEPARIWAERVPLGSPAGGIEPFVQRVMGALAVALDPRWGVKFVPGLQAPSFDSYREYRTAVGLFDRRQFREAGQGFARAFAMEPQFVLYAVRQAYALRNTGDCVGVDSIGAALRAQRSAISEYEAHYLDRVLAWCSGDYEAALRSAKAMARLAPRSPYAKYLAARSAIFVNRPAEAAAGLREAGVGVMEEEATVVDAFYRDLSLALHRLGRYAEEWEVNGEWLANPRTIGLYEALARRLEIAAADGAPDSVAPLITRILTTTAPPAGLHAAMARAAEELSWHGYPDAAAQVAQAVVERIQSETSPLVILRTLFLLQRMDEARTLADSLLAADTENPSYWGWVGALAARGGDRAGAQQADRWLAAFDDPYTRSGAILWRARIQAQLGETESAILLLREAYTAGANFLGSAFHGSPFLEPLREDPGFEEFVRPKG